MNDKTKKTISKILIGISIFLFLIGFIVIIYSLYEYFSLKSTSPFAGFAFIGVTISALFLILPSTILSIIGLILRNNKKIVYIPTSLLLLDLIYLIWVFLF